ncbi:S9 family peptidase [Williamwhitmania taraxaci]|uniref:Proline-specific endopeptidase n=1 Tax=Williamwhitmania taraxaci TaxID=1640674 RepID=A0A1G6M2K4_9BACT|nr:S9 family peptidase [Williamwhitmania taraxaci]SDC49762.1 oligopeptidase B [Williamwhitmania taraxaci]
MSIRLFRLFLATLFVATIISCSRVKPPIAEKKPYEITAFGDTRIDPYFWMQERDTPAVLANLHAENAYANSVLKPTEALQEKLFNEMKGRIKEEDVTAPYFDNGYFYYTRFEKNQEYPIYCRKKGTLNTSEEILLNVNELADKYSFFNVADVSVSSNNKIIAYGVDTLSRRKYTIYFKDLVSGKLLPTKISNTTGETVWANDNNTIFYTIKDSSLRPYKVLKHKLSNLDETEDPVVFQEKDLTFSLTLDKSKTNDFIYIASISTLATEYQYLNANTPDASFKIVQPRERGLEYNVTDFDGKFYFVTNYNAKNFRLMAAPITIPSKLNWKEVIPHRADVLLEGFDVYKSFYTVQERKQGLTNIRIVDWKTNTEHVIDFGEETYTASLDYNPDFYATKVRFRYTSLTTPVSVYDYDVATQTKILLKRQEVLGADFNPENYEAKRLWAKASDGVLIPISLVYKKGIKLDGSNPSLIYAYGSYGASMDPYFSTARLSLLDRGFVYAIAHVRGGQELGRQWYEDGKLLKKKNTFTDFIACSEFLIKEGYTSPSMLFAQGGSAGGLLMGAIANMRPDLYKGIIAEVPFVDVVTTMLDESIPLTTGEFDEWGNPKIKEYYDYMKSYSPYDNVTAKDYPNMLVTSGYYDSQVQYFEPQKWVAKLRDMKTDDNLLLFKIDMEAGHGGASGRFKSLHEVALNYAFMLYLLEKTN